MHAYVWVHLCMCVRFNVNACVCVNVCVLCHRVPHFSLCLFSPPLWLLQSYQATQQEPLLCEQASPRRMDTHLQTHPVTQGAQRCQFLSQEVRLESRSAGSLATRGWNHGGGAAWARGIKSLMMTVNVQQSYILFIER